MMLEELRAVGPNAILSAMRWTRIMCALRVFDAPQRFLGTEDGWIIQAADSPSPWSERAPASLHQLSAGRSRQEQGGYSLCMALKKDGPY